jgi:hypothetical protein
MGFLGRLGDVPVGASHVVMGSPVHMAGGLPGDGPTTYRAPGAPGKISERKIINLITNEILLVESIMASHPHQFSWQSGELHMLLGGPGGGGATVPMDTGGRGTYQGKDASQDTVEVMSTDSSSSSSSDSQ